jgi:hypothetical protein
VGGRVRFAMNGDVQVYSEPGQGTTVRVYLPRALPAADAPPAALWADEPPHSPAARVLLVDDEPVLLRMTEKILRRLGHDVTSAPKGAVALDALTSSGFADTPEGRSIGSAEGVSFLPKPYTRQELKQAIEAALAGGGAQ